MLPASYPPLTDPLMDAASEGFEGSRAARLLKRSSCVGLRRGVEIPVPAPGKTAVGVDWGVAYLLLFTSPCVQCKKISNPCSGPLAWGAPAALRHVFPHISPNGRGATEHRRPPEEAARSRTLRSGAIARRVKDVGLPASSAPCSCAFGPCRLGFLGETQATLTASHFFLFSFFLQSPSHFLRQRGRAKATGSLPLSRRG